MGAFVYMMNILYSSVIIVASYSQVTALSERLLRGRVE